MKNRKGLHDLLSVLLADDAFLATVLFLEVVAFLALLSVLSAILIFTNSICLYPLVNACANNIEINTDITKNDNGC